MDNFDVFTYLLGVVTGLPWGAILAAIVVAIVGKVKNERK